jgi:L-threonylcarbamoyladenylate synthase
MPTDTLYGIVGRAGDSDTVERIYKLRKRAPEKPCIILIGDWGEVEKFGINISKIKIPMTNVPTSFVLDCPGEEFAYLHRGTNTLAFRMPTQLELQNLLMQTGPLIAPSANLEGAEPARNIEQAKKYFSDSVDLYIDAGEITGKPSKVIKLREDGTSVILRP